MFDTLLVEFNIEREYILISLSPNLNMSQLYEVKKDNKGHYYIPKKLYAMCNFDYTLLPIKLNLPMVCKPLNCLSGDWSMPSTINDLRGGYLCMPTSSLYRYRLLSIP